MALKELAQFHERKRNRLKVLNSGCSCDFNACLLIIAEVFNSLTETKGEKERKGKEVGSELDWK